MKAVPAPDGIYDEFGEPVTIYDKDGNQIAPFLFLDSTNINFTIENYILGQLEEQFEGIFDQIPDLCEDWDAIKAQVEENTQLLNEIQCF